MTGRDTVVLGRVAGLHGVRGWIKVYSDTAPVEGIFGYRRWSLALGDETRVYDLEEGRTQGRRLIAKLGDVDDRDAATALVGARIGVSRDALPATAPGEYYWADLIGLEVETVDGKRLGTVTRLLETGANDVIVVEGERERLIPWLHGRVIESVSLDERRIRVHWDPEF